MEIKDYKDLKKMICKELEEIKSTKSLGMAEIEIIDKLTHTIKNIDKIIETEDDEYSHDGGWRAAGNYSGRRYSMDDDSSMNSDSYASRRGMHYVRGHYSRDDGTYRNGGSYADGRYSYADGIDHLVDQMEEMMNDGSVSQQEKNMVRKAMNMLTH